jgi:hypothetical protein
MAFTETPKEKEKRLAYYAKNKADAKTKEDKADAETTRKFSETTNTDTSKNTNVMGDTYKKGGKVMKKTKRYEDGGEVEFETKQGRNEGSSINEDTRAKAMAAIAAGGQKDEPAIPKKTAAKLTPKAEAKPTPKAKVNSVDQAKDVIKGKDVTAPSAKSFTEAGGSTKARTQKVDTSELSVKAPKLYDPLAKYEQTGPKRPEAAAPKKKSSSSSVDHSMGNAMRRGGSVSSASKRADGCAIRGKTRA